MEWSDIENAPTPLVDDGVRDNEETVAPYPMTSEGKRLVRKQQGVQLTRFNPVVAATIAKRIEEGAFLHVAAESVGISRQLVWLWMNDARPVFKAFQSQVMAAHATARHSAEMRVHTSMPDKWLTKGPGRDRGDTNAPGWLSSTGQINHSGEVKHSADINIRHSADYSGLSEDELRNLIALHERVVPAAALPEHKPDIEDDNTVDAEFVDSQTT